MAPDDATLRDAVARQVLLGMRESATIAGRLGCQVAAVNAALAGLRAECGGCIALARPYAGEERFVVAVADREALRRTAAWPETRGHAGQGAPRRRSLPS